MFNYYIISIGISITMTILTMYVDYKRGLGRGKGNVGGAFVLIMLCLIPVINILMALFMSMTLLSINDYKNSSTDEKFEIDKKNSQTMKLMDKETELKYRSIDYLNGISYIGGHESFSQTLKGTLYLKKDGIVFNATLLRGGFEVPLNQIDEITYDTSEKITLSRFMVLGLASIVFKKKTYYLILNYTNEIGTKNQIIFETGNIKQQNFANALNVSRNNYLKTIYKDKASNFLDI